MPRRDPLVPAGFIAQMLEEGMSATAALRSFREAGGHVTTQTWYQVAGEVKAALGNRSIVAGLAGDLVPDASRFIPWSAGSDGLRLYHVDVVSRNTEFDTIVRSPWSVTTADLLTPDEAVNMAISEYQPIEERYNQTTMYGVLTGLYVMTGR